MGLAELSRFAVGALTGHRLRTALSVTGMAVGTAAVVTLTALGEGARRYVLKEFAALGSDLLIVLPGKVETTGAAPFGGVVHDLTIDDYRAVVALPRVLEAAPLAVGTEMVRVADRGRSVPVLGTTAEFVKVRRVQVAAGRFLPPGDPDRGGYEMVLGSKVAKELCGAENPLGKVARVGAWRFRIVGVMAPRGRGLGFDFDDLVYIPVRTAMRVFNRPSLFRILVEVRIHQEMNQVRRDVLGLLAQRHRAEDTTVISQDALLLAFSSIMQVLTLALAGIASVSLVVAGVGIMNVMLISVTERRAEIGLLKAIGADDRQVLLAFLVEASLLAIIGGVAGLAVGMAAVGTIVRVFPGFPAQPPVWAVAAALALSLVTGVVFGVWPARQATRLDPVSALARR